jgi:uncharacterized protein (DUF2147 family)
MTPATRLAAAALLTLLPFGALPDGMTDIEGVWINGDGDGWIELYIQNEELKGRIIGSPDDPQNLKPSRLDTENPDTALRSRELRGLTILTGFRYDGDGEWKDGRIYDPNSGNTYRGTIRMEEAGSLKLRGYVGISLFGRTETWTRRPEQK